jgi:hypothetical protein
LPEIPEEEIVEVTEEEKPQAEKVEEPVVSSWCTKVIHVLKSKLF